MIDTLFGLVILVVVCLVAWAWATSTSHVENYFEDEPPK